MTSFNISIQNMTCAGCAGRAERALHRIGRYAGSCESCHAFARVDTSMAPKEFQQALQVVGYPAKN